MTRAPHSKPTEFGKAALGDGGGKGPVAVALYDEVLDEHLVTLASVLAQQARRRLHILYLLAVPRAYALTAPLDSETVQAERMIRTALQIAAQWHCPAHSALIRGRSIEHALIEEVQDAQVALLFLRASRGREDCMAHILAHAPCRVWLVQPPVV